MAKFIPYNYSRSHGSAPTEKQLQKWNDTVNIHSEDSFKHVCKEIYDALDLLINPLAWKKIYPNAKFTKTCFYNLINVKMRTAQHRQQELENKND